MEGGEAAGGDGAAGGGTWRSVSGTVFGAGAGGGPPAQAGRSPRRRAAAARRGRDTIAAIMRDADGDRIDIVGLAVPAVIGAFDWERKIRQRVVLDLTLFVDFRRPAPPDRLKDALDYK